MIIKEVNIKHYLSKIENDLLKKMIGKQITNISGPNFTKYSQVTSFYFGEGIDFDFSDKNNNKFTLNFKLNGIFHELLYETIFGKFPKKNCLKNKLKHGYRRTELSMLNQ